MEPRISVNADRWVSSRHRDILSELVKKKREDKRILMLKSPCPTKSLLKIEP